jgi:hypothetical protein
VTDEKKPGGEKGPANCVFDVYELRLAMQRPDVAALFDFNSDAELTEKALEGTGADKVELYFDHRDRLWMVKSFYTIAGIAEGEALLDKMSKDYRFQTQSSRVAFDLEETESGGFMLYVRYTEANLKREYIHHKLAEAQNLKAEEEKRRIEKSIEDLEEEDYIPTGPMMF